MKRRWLSLLLAACVALAPAVTYASDAQHPGGGAETIIISGETTPTDEEPPTEGETAPTDEEPPTEGETTPTDGETTPIEGETAPTDEEPPTDGETTPIEGETAPTDEEPPTEGETTPTEGETTPTDGETTPVEGETTPVEGQVQCTCHTLCTEGMMNPDCPVCSAEGADPAACQGEAPSACTRETLCAEGSVNPDCPVCSAEGADLSACQGEAPSACTCETLCAEGSVNPDCPVCGAEGADLAACLGTAPAMLAMAAPLADEATVYVGSKELKTTVGTLVYAKTDDSGNVQAATADDYNISWDGSTLTLNDANIQEAATLPSPWNDGSAAIFCMGNLTISLEGSNTVEGQLNTNGNSCGILTANGGLTIQGSGILEVTGGTATASGESSPSSIAIQSGGNLNIQGEGVTVTATGGKASYAGDKSGRNSYSYGIRVTEGNVTITGSTVTATGGDLTTDGDSYGIYVRGNGTITINGGSLTATGGDTDDGSSYGIQSGGLTVEGGGTVIAKSGQAGSYSRGIGGGVTVNSGRVEATGGQAGSYSYGIDGGVTVNSGGTVKATGGTAGSYSRGISCSYDGAITINGGEVTATGGTATSNTVGSSTGSYGLYAPPHYNSGGGSISISGGEVTAQGQTAGICAYVNQQGDGGNITVSGGTVTATGTGTDSYGIYAGTRGNEISITGGSTQVTATGATAGVYLNTYSGKVTVGAGLAVYVGENEAAAEAAGPIDFTPEKNIYNLVEEKKYFLCEEAPLSVTISASGEGITSPGDTVTKTYDSKTITLTATPKNAGEGAAISYQWYKAGDDGTDEEVPNANSNTLELKNVADSGSYLVRITVDGETVPSNPITVTINPATPTVNVGPHTITYTDQTQFDQIDISYTITLKNGEEPNNENVYISYYSDQACENQVGGTNIISAGTYYVKVTFQNHENYTTASGTATLTIKAATFTVTEDEDYSVPYDGKGHSIGVTAPADAAVTYTYTVDGQTQTSQTPFTFTDAGTYTVSYTASKANYKDVTGELKVEIKKATLTAAYVSETIYEGETPALAVTVTGFVEGEDAATLAAAGDYTAPTVTADDTAVGSHELTPTGGAAKNYDFDYIPGTLTIQERPSSGDSGRAERNFWEDVEEKLAEAAPGDTVKANARSFDQMPYWVMEALGEAEGVTLHLTWNGGEDIVIPASAALTPEAGRIYYPLSYLEGMAFPAAEPENPETGGVLEVTAPVQAVQPQVTAPDQGLTEAPAVIEETPEVLEEAPEVLPGVTEPQEGASDSAPAAAGGGLMFAGAAAVLAAAVIGLLLWRSRKGEGEGR